MTPFRFLAAKMHMDSIARKPSRTLVRKALEDLPRGLDATYDDAMRRIMSQPSDRVEIARKVLCWVAFSRRPLCLTELQHAMAVEPGINELNEDDLPDDETMISTCAGLVIVEAETNVVRLARKFHYDTYLM
jgi:hypothetical protein